MRRLRPVFGSPLGASDSYAHGLCVPRLLASVSFLVMRELLAPLSELLDERAEHIRAMLHRIASRPGGASWDGEQQLRCLRFGARLRDGRLVD